jgi:hypothetical protein
MHFSDKDPSRAKVLETILVLFIACVVITYLTRSVYPFYIGMFIGVTGIFLPVAALYIHRGWMKLGEVLGMFTGKIILTVIYILVVLPTALLSKKLRQRVLQQRGKNSYYITRDHLYTKEDLENMW